ncbi:MAG TPA: ATP-binding protein [Anaerolineae bacterium]|nr:ATP-binding protein [Anaerolineae bacterium]HOQ97422.1 ATP-binding protein [Anaerolineae bacterium]HPL29462.1 ATP-binding protein [Anaerolineae bacterium]
MATAELEPQALRRTADPAQLDFQSTDQLEPAVEVIGQPRAVEAIDFAVSIANPGYNLFALGPSGTGRTTTIMRYLEREAATRPVPDDWCYVNNFAEPHRPRALRLPPGKGAQLRNDMNNLVDELITEIPRAFEGEDYARQKEEINRQLAEERQKEFSQLERYAAERGFSLVRTPSGIAIVPVREGKPLSPEEFAALDKPTREHLENESQQIQTALNATLRLARRLERAARDRVQRLDREVANFAAAPMFDELREAYSEFPAVIQYLSEAQKDVIENLDTFRPNHGPQMPPELPAPLARMAAAAQAPSFDKYRVNVLVDNAQAHGAPLIHETNPSFPNLIGRIEYQAQFGALVTNFTLIKPGALHRANGGYLVLDVRDVLVKPFAWDALKRALKTACVHVEEMGQELRFAVTTTLEPEPIPLDVKAVLIGDPMVYYLLEAYDEDLRELFKVRADFAVAMDWTPENALLYARFIANVCREQKLRPFAPSGVAAILEHSARMAEDQHKLSARLGEVVDLVREASFWAGHNERALVEAADVHQAIATRIYRSNQVEERIREMIARGIIRIDATGEAVGQVNGLSVLALADYSFGRPSRITARIFPGRQGVVDIQRQTKMGGPIHSKGVLILSGYLGGKYAVEQPLTLTASIAFEQLYEGVEGDSASSTELYALLSSLSGYPLRQGLAVTGSVDQHGRVQAIGGANHKIEGFYDVCRVLGLNGEQGVIVPADNVQHLMLREDVVEAVRQGRFHIYAISNVDQGIEVLTGRPAGERAPDGHYPEGSVNAAVEARLRELAEAVREFGPGAEERSAIEPEKEPEPVRFA